VLVKNILQKKTKKVKRKIQNENEQTPAKALDGFKATSSQREPLVKRTQNCVGHYQSSVVFPINGISKDLIKKIAQNNKNNKARETRSSKHNKFV
jgi:hypothetical protein